VGSIVLITGAMASGKSTVAQALAERFPRGVHVRGDIFRRMIVSGRAEMTDPPSTEALRQLRLRYRLGVETSLRYAEAGFDVVFQDVIIGPDLESVVAELGDVLSGVVVLCPPPEILAQRDAERDKTGYRGWDPVSLDRQLHDTTPRIGLWLDNSELTVEQTVDQIAAALGLVSEKC
jgi:chloramphenicol 3-O-phosphotransferase